MAPKKRAEKQAQASAVKAITEDLKQQALGEAESIGDKLREQGIVLTFSQDSNRINHRNVRDISVPNLTLAYQGTPLIEEAEFNLNYGNRYDILLFSLLSRFLTLLLFLSSSSPLSV
jgi:hypothetical protein